MATWQRGGACGITHLQHRRVALDGHRIARASPGGEDARTLTVLEAADAWPDDRRADEGRHAASHVHHARASEVDLPAQ